MWTHHLQGRDMGCHVWRAGASTSPWYVECYLSSGEGPELVRELQTRCSWVHLHVQYQFWNQTPERGWTPWTTPFQSCPGREVTGSSEAPD